MNNGAGHKDNWTDRDTDNHQNEDEEDQRILPTGNRRLLAQGEADTTTVVTYTVMLWYTAGFASSFAYEGNDMDAYFELMITQTNQGYINSEIPVSIQTFTN